MAATVSVLAGLQKGGRHDYYSNDGIRIFFNTAYPDFGFNHVEKFTEHKKIGPHTKLAYF